MGRYHFSRTGHVDPVSQRRAAVEGMYQKNPVQQNPVLSQLVYWLKTDTRPARSDVEGGGRKDLSYWSQWVRLFLKGGLVFRRWQNKETGQEIYQQIRLPESLVPQVLYALHDSP